MKTIAKDFGHIQIFSGSRFIIRLTLGGLYVTQCSSGVKFDGDCRVIKIKKVAEEVTQDNHPFFYFWHMFEDFLRWYDTMCIDWPKNRSEKNILIISFELSHCNYEYSYHVLSVAQWLEDSPTERKVVGSKLTKASSEVVRKGIRIKSSCKSLATVHPQYLRKKTVVKKMNVQNIHNLLFWIIKLIKNTL